MVTNNLVYQITAKDSTASAWASVYGTARKGMEGLQAQVSSFGGSIGAALSAALSVATVSAWMKETSEIQGAFKDLQESFGATDEGLSRLRSAIQLSGGELGDIEGPMGKLVKSLNDADEAGSDAGRALKALGLDAKEIRSMSVDQSFIQIAEAIQVVEDGSGKAAIATALYGKEGAKLIPILNDIAEVGSNYTRITQAQIDASDEFDKNIKRLNATFQDFKIQVGNGVIPSINLISEELRDASAAGLSLWQILNSVARRDGPFNESWEAKAKASRETIASLASDLKKLDDWDRHAGVQSDIDARIGKEKALLAFYEVRIGARTLAMSKQLGIDDIAGGKKTVDFRLKDDGGKSAFKGVSARANLNAGEETEAAKAWADALKALNDQLQTSQMKALDLGAAQSTVYKLMTSSGWADMPDSWKQIAVAQFEVAQAAESAAQADALIRDAYNQTIQPLRDRIAELSREVDLYGLTETQIASTIAARIEEGIVIAQANGASEEQLVFLRQEAELRREIATVSLAKDVLDANAKAAEDSKKNWEKAADDINRSMTDSLFQAMESNKPIAQAFAESFGNALKTTLLRSVSDGLMAPIRSVFSQLVSSAGPALASMFTASANGNAFGPSGMMAFATGGVVSGATVFRHGGGLGVMGEAGPEAILPLTRTSSGDLGVKAQGGNVGAVSIRVELDNQSSQPAQATSSSTRFDGESFVVSVVLRDLNNNGPIRQTLGG